MPRFVTQGALSGAPTYDGTDEAVALYMGVKRTALKGYDTEIVNMETAEIVWYIEADIKLSDDDVTFPVIVHLRDDD